MPSSTTSTNASPTDLSSTERNGGESICESALMAASSIFILHCGRRRLSREPKQGARIGRKRFAANAAFPC